MFTSPWQKPFRGMQINKAHPLARGLVGCWVMNEATGDKVFDLSGSGNHGTITNADWVARGLDFDGTGDYVDTAVIEPDEYTIVIETNLSSKSTDKRLLGTTDTQMPYLIWYDVGNDCWGVRTYDNSNNLWTDDNNPTTPNIGDKYQLVLSYSNPHSIFYINGDVETSDSSLSDVAKKTSTHLRFGGGLFLSPDFAGEVYYVYIYNRALTPEEIVYIHREPYAMFEQPTSPELLYYEPPTGVTIPVLMHHYNQMMRA